MPKLKVNHKQIEVFHILVCPHIPLCVLFIENPNESDVDIKNDARLKALPQVLITIEERQLAEIQKQKIEIAPNSQKLKPSTMPRNVEIIPTTQKLNPAPTSEKELNPHLTNSQKLKPSTMPQNVEIIPTTQKLNPAPTSEKELNPHLKSTKPASSSRMLKPSSTSKTVGSSTTSNCFKPAPNTGPALPTFKPVSVTSDKAEDSSATKDGPKTKNGSKRKLEEELSSSSKRSYSPSTPSTSKFFKIFDSIEKKPKMPPTENTTPTSKIPSLVSGSDLVGVAGFCLDCDGCESDCQHKNHTRKYIPDLSVHSRIEGHQRLQSVMNKNNR